jgi:hypothetical protein
MTLPHILIVQAVYTDPELSQRRLNITRHTLAPALESQIHKPTVHLAQQPEDPHALERARLLESTGCVVLPIWRDSWKLYGEDYEIPKGKCLVSRCDDDDSLSRDFFSLTYDIANKQDSPCALLWPNGYVFWRSRGYRLQHPVNQFVSLLTYDGDSPHDQGHWKYCEQWKTVVVSNNPGWIWIRHADAHTSTLAKYRKTQVNRIDAPRFNINLRAVDRAIAASGIASANYKEHSSSVSDWLSYFGSDKVSLHTYGEFYDSLFKQLKPTNVLEIGVYAGASINAWHRTGAYTVGVDIAPKCDDTGDQIIVARMPQDADRLISELPQQDIIIDDGSHKFSDYTQTYNKLKVLLKPNGVYVIEDIQSEREATALRAAGWNIADWRSSSGRYDDVIAWRTN